VSLIKIFRKSIRILNIPIARFRIPNTCSR
jgi:hypothetical protein